MASLEARTEEEAVTWLDNAWHEETMELVVAPLSIGKEQV
jgi:hypothetical protein